jgi:hypothetical protein
MVLSRQNQFAFMLKTYSTHLDFAIRLLESITKFNVQAIHTYIVVPRDDLSIFERLDFPNTSLIIEEDIPTKFACKPVSGIRPGYINQEISKLAFHRMNLVEHYLCLDSDGEFLREFRFSDFMTTSGQPYSVLVEDNEIQIDSDYYSRYWEGRKESQNRILDFLGMDKNEVWLNCHNFQIFSSDVLRLFDKFVLEVNEFDYVDLMEISAYEFAWYNFFLQNLGKPLRIREPFFKVFHTEHQLGLARLSNLDHKGLARGYMGVCLQSNFLGNNGSISLEENIFVTYSRFMRYRDLALVFTAKLCNDLRKPKILIYRILNFLGFGWCLRLFTKLKTHFKHT